MKIWAAATTLHLVESRFEEYTQLRLQLFLQRYVDDFSPAVAESIRATPSIHSQLNRLFEYAAGTDIKLYVLIDEYDNFANSLLVDSGQQAYHALTHGDGFFRHFFAILKGGTSDYGAGISRLFLTGVSPMTLDDVTSGFNIGDNLSLTSEFDESDPRVFASVSEPQRCVFLPK